MIRDTAERSTVATAAVERIGMVATFSLVQAALLFIGAGRLDWIWAWVFAGITVAVVLISGIFLLRNSAEMVAERGRP